MALLNIGLRQITFKILLKTKGYIIWKNYKILISPTLTIIFTCSYRGFCVLVLILDFKYALVWHLLFWQYQVSVRWVRKKIPVKLLIHYNIHCSRIKSLPYTFSFLLINGSSLPSFNLSYPLPGKLSWKIKSTYSRLKS